MYGPMISMECDTNLSSACNGNSARVHVDARLTLIVQLLLQSRGLYRLV